MLVSISNNTVLMIPPLVITVEEVDLLVSRLEYGVRVVGETAGRSDDLTRVGVA